MHQPLNSDLVTPGQATPSLPTSRGSPILSTVEEKSGPVSVGLGGLSSLSTLSGLLNTASTFRSKKDEGRSGKGETGGRTRYNQFDSGRFDEFSKGFGGGMHAGRSTGWKDEGGRTRNDGLQKSLGPRPHAYNESDPFQSRAGDTRSIRSIASPVLPPVDASLPPSPPKTQEGTAGQLPASPSAAHSSPSVAHLSPPSAAAQLSSPAAVSSEPETPDSGAATKPDAWRPRRHIEASEQLRRDINGLLNKLSVENFPKIAEKLAVLTEDIKTKEDLEVVVEHVLDKAFGEPDFCELYADLCLVLSLRCPPSLRVASLGKQSLFSTFLIQKWKEAFDKMPPTVELTEAQKSELSPEEQEILTVKLKTRVRGMCVSLAEFVVRRMVGMGGFSRAASVLLSKQTPEEHYVEGLCQMLITAGAFLDDDPAGSSLVETCFGRLHELLSQGVCSKRINCLIQDLIDARRVGWHKKIHKEKAKALSALKTDVENADLVGGAVIAAQFGTIVKLGQRSNLTNETYAEYLKEQEDRYKQLKH